MGASIVRLAAWKGVVGTGFEAGRDRLRCDWFGRALVFAILVKMTFCHGDRGGRVFAQSFGGEAEKIRQKTSVERLFERREFRGKQGGVSKRDEVGRRGRLDGCVAAM
jgi:hypothetical protein